MPLSSTTQSVLAEYELSLAWGAWVELGVSGWQQTHVNWVMDPEPLIIHTAYLADADPRLRDEALDWCIHHWRYVSRVRLRNLLRRQSAEVLEAWGPFGATVSKHSGTHWPLGTESFRYRTTGQSSLDTMVQPSRAWLRLRAMFGLGARTEILRYFLSSHRRATIATIAQHVGYAKRNVADECDSLEKAGVLGVQHAANRFYYTLARGDELRAWLGDIAPIKPNWTALFTVTSALVALEESAKSLSRDALSVEAHRSVRLLNDELDTLGIEQRPRLAGGKDHWPVVRDFAERHMAAWATGKWGTTELPQT